MIINIFLLIILFIFITLYIVLIKDIKNIENQLKYIEDRETNVKVFSKSSNKRIRSLILELNKIITSNQKKEINYKNMDMEIKQSIANISHDLRTPLTSIIGYLQLMEEDDSSENEKEEYMKIVKERTKSLQMLITSFYDLSMLEGKEYKFNLQSINISNLLCEVIASFYNDFINKDIEPSIDIEENVPNIIGDENGVKRILLNLIQNILRYGEEFISISLKVKDEEIITTFTNGTSKLTAEDSKLIFRRFFTADRTRNGDSTGIGLAVTKGLVEQMGHKIYSEFKDGKLSIIIIWKIKNI